MKPYAPPPVEAVVEELEVITEYFQGRADYYAVVKGRLSSNVALLIDAEQWREGSTLFIKVREQTPRGAVPPPDMVGLPPYQSKIPIETLGLVPGEYVVNANGILSTLIVSDESEELELVEESNFTEV